MTRTRHAQLSLPRLLAFCLACLCLWMGTAGTAVHTDSLRLARSASAQAAIHQAAPVVVADNCAACQWTQGVQSQGLALFCYAVPLYALMLLAAILLAAPLRRVLHCRSPRAPPVCFSA